MRRRRRPRRGDARYALVHVELLDPDERDVGGAGDASGQPTTASERRAAPPS